MGAPGGIFNALFAGRKGKKVPGLFSGQEK